VAIECEQDSSAAHSWGRLSGASCCLSDRPLGPVERASVVAEREQDYERLLGTVLCAQPVPDHIGEADQIVQPLKTCIDLRPVYAQLVVHEDVAQPGYWGQMSRKLCWQDA
jgi:hypothetical protein